MIIYPVYGCWVWGGGWLADLGVNFGLGNGHVDFAGSSVVHMTGGVTGLAGALDPRPADRQVQQGRLAQRDPRPRRADGRARHADPGLRLVRVQPRQHPGGDRPADRLDRRLHHAGHRGRLPQLDPLHVGRLRQARPHDGAATACSPAPVAITAPCAFVDPVGAVIIGAIAGVLVIWSVLFVERMLKVDDPVGAISVHGVNGAWGCLCDRPVRQRRVRRRAGTAWRTAPTGLFYGGGVASSRPRRSACWPISSGSSAVASSAS